MNQISVFIIMNTNYFELWFHFKSELRRSAAAMQTFYQAHIFEPRK